MIYTKLLTAAALAMSFAVPALASEGQGEPFPNAITRPITAQTVVSDTASYSSPVFGGTNAVVMAATTANSGVIEPLSSEAGAETANSFPAHALDGTVDGAYAVEVSQYLSGQATTPLVGTQTSTR